MHYLPVIASCIFAGGLVGVLLGARWERGYWASQANSNRGVVVNREFYYVLDEEHMLAAQRAMRHAEQRKKRCEAVFPIHAEMPRPAIFVNTYPESNN